MKLMISIFLILICATGIIFAQSLSIPATTSTSKDSKAYPVEIHSHYSVVSGVDSLTRYVDQIFTSQELVTTMNKLYATVTDTFGTHNLLMDIYSPPVSDPVSQRPVIVWIHGGNFSGGARQDFAAYSIEFARRGYVTATIDYRLLKALNPQATSLEAARVGQADAESAITYLIANASSYRIDTSTFIVGGWSAGSATSWRVGYDYEFRGHIAPIVKGAVPIDAENLKPSDFKVGDPPWIWIQRGQPTDEYPAPYVHAADSLGIKNQWTIIPGTSHTDLMSSTYTPAISVIVARFLADNVTNISVTSVMTPTDIPAKYSLEQNYPNPFNPSTLISYYLPGTSRITLKVYNLLGQEIITLVDGVQIIGDQTVRWNARNARGETIPTGVYLYRFEAARQDGSIPTIVRVRKMILMQ